jgi:polyferredoxin
VVFIGFVLNASLTYSNYVGMIAGTPPGFLERPVWFLMVPGILFITVIWGRNFYCSWICPFGAVQEGVYRSLNLINVKISPDIRVHAARFRWPILWLAAVAALLAGNPGAASYEPVSIFFDASGNTAQWIITLLVLVISIVQMRFWCNHFCPVGAILDGSAQLKRRVLGLMKPRERVPERSNGDRDAASPSQRCSGCSAQADKPAMSVTDKFFAGLIIFVNVLILCAVLQNF